MNCERLASNFGWFVFLGQIMYILSVIKTFVVNDQMEQLCFFIFYFQPYKEVKCPALKVCMGVQNSTKNAQKFLHCFTLFTLYITHIN